MNHAPSPIGAYGTRNVSKGYGVSNGRREEAGAASADTFGWTDHPEFPGLDRKNTGRQMGVDDTQHSFIAMLHFLASDIVAKPDGGVNTTSDPGNTGRYQTQSH